DTLYVFYYRLLLSTNETFGDGDDLVILQFYYDYVVEANENYLIYSDLVLPDVANGEYFVAMALDTSHTIDESDETDNLLIAEDKFHVNGPPVVDLAPKDAIAGESAVKVGVETDFSVSIDNLGPDPVGPYTVRLYYSAD